MRVLSVSSPMHISAQLANVKKNGIQNSQMLYASDNVSFAAEPYRGIKEKRALKELSDLDIKLKTTSFQPWLLIESFLLRLSSF